MENISYVSLIQPSLSQSPYGLALYDTLLVWMDPYDGKQLSLFDVRNGIQVHRFGFIGRGPGEMSMWPKGRKYQKKYFHIYDNQRSQILEFPIAEVAKDSAYRPENSFSFLGTGLSCVTQVNDSLFIGETHQSNFIYALVNDRGHELFSGCSYPKDSWGEISPIAKSIAYQGNFFQNPDDNSLLAHVGINGVVIDILKIEDNRIIRKNRLEYILPKYKPVIINEMFGALMDDDNIIGCCSVSVSKDFIYILYADKTTINEHDERNERCSDIILAFDWSGQPIKYYRSDVDLYQICVSENDQTLYGVAMNPEAELVKFILSEMN